MLYPLVVCLLTLVSLSTTTETLVINVSLIYSPPQRLEGNESHVFFDISGCVVAVAHRSLYSEVEHSNLCQIAFVLINIDFVLINMPP